MDGAGTLTVFTRIILPMCTPILATVGIFSAVNQWNSFQDTLIYMTDSSSTRCSTCCTPTSTRRPHWRMRPRRIRRMSPLWASAATPTSIRMTVSVIVVLPIMFTYPFFQRFFVKGMMLGAVKG